MNAVISRCGKYRYSLERFVDKQEPISATPKTVMFIGVNPSTADAQKNDPTIRKMLGFASRWGYDRILVGNLFAYRATDVRELRNVLDPYGPQYWKHFYRMLDEADVVVLCWGSRTKMPKGLRGRVSNMLECLRGEYRDLRHFGLTESGDPKHPLMLAYETPLTPFE